MPETVDEATARKRWLAINLVRLGGVALVVVALLMIDGGEGAALIAGYVLLVAGLLDVLLVPRMLARKWRSPRR